MYETIDDKLKSSVYFIETTSYEKQKVWELYHEKTNWESDGEGVYRQIGWIGNPKKERIVSVHFGFAKIYGKRICFYEAATRFVDWAMIEKYIKTNYRNIPLGSASNFHNVKNALHK